MCIELGEGQRPRIDLQGISRVAVPCKEATRGDVVLGRAIL